MSGFSQRRSAWGLLFVGDDAARHLPPIRFILYVREEEMTGFTDDAAVPAMWRRLRADSEADRFTEGPVEVLREPPS